MPNDNITVYVEVKPLKYRDMYENLTDIFIYELIDNNLSLISKPNYGLITSNLENINEYRNSIDSLDTLVVSGSKSVDLSWGNNYGELHISEMNPWERLLYSYSVRPKTVGTFSIDSVARTPYFSDIDQKLTLDVSKVGLYDISIVPSKNKVFQKEPFQIYYTITYLGDGHTSAP